MKKLRVTYGRWGSDEDGERLGKCIRVNGKYWGFMRHYTDGYHIWISEFLYRYIGWAPTEKEANRLVKQYILERVNE